jgi:predicted extracellular nuclease
MHKSLYKMFSVITMLAMMLMALPMQSAEAIGGGSGSIGLTTLGSPYTQNFDSLANTGTTNNLTVNGWFLDEAGTSGSNNGQYAAGTGSGAAGDVYSFGAAATAERAFGTLFSGTLTPTIGAQFTNNTGSAVTSLTVSYTGEMWRAGVTNRGAADRLNFQLSTNATSLITGTWTDYDNLDFNSPNIMATAGALNGNSAGNQAAISFTITGISIPAGSSFWIRWTEFDISPGADDGLAIDDFSLTPNLVLVPTNPSGIGAASPATIATGDTTLLTVAVTPGTNPTSTGLAVTADLSPIGGSPTQAFFDDGTNGDATAGDNTFSYQATAVTPTACGATLTAAITDAEARQGSATITLTVQEPATIHEIQGASHISPLNGKCVKDVLGVVTSKRSNGFNMQDPNPDGDEATSEGLFVFTSSVPTVSVGDSISVSGSVTEFRPGGTGGLNNLTTTEIVSPTITPVGSGSPLPAPTVIGNGGRVPPTAVIEDDASGSVETSGVFDPAQDGIDFYESMEGMLVQVNDAVVVGPTSDFGEIFVLADNGANAGLRTARGGIVIQPGDFNPERIQFDNTIAAVPDANVGDHINSPAVGVLDYSFGNFEILNTSALTVVPGGLQREVTTPPGNTQLSVGTMNVENLDANDPDAKFNELASLIVTTLQSPDILAVEEIQDNNGPTNDTVVDATATFDELIAAIVSAGGPAYQFRQINPADDQDGGEPGGNIRVGFLFRTDRGLAFVDRPGGGSTTATTVVNNGGTPELSASPGRIDPANIAFTNSRKPLVGEFTFNGAKLFVIANHFNSKGGDQPLFGHSQPPVLGSEAQRIQQAQVVNAFVDSILAVDPNANVVVAGDLNDFEFSTPVNTLEGGVLHTLMETLPPNERYSYVFEGNSQSLDHILISDNLFETFFAYDVVHVNAEFADQASDHDPQVVHLFYDFTGFFQPVDNLPTFNTVKAGQSIPIKFSLNGDQGLDVIAEGYPKSEGIECNSTAPADGVEETVTTGNSSLSYDPTTDTYTYVWKSNKSWANSCRQFVLKLADGTIYRANFNFTK